MLCVLQFAGGVEQGKAIQNELASAGLEVGFELVLSESEFLTELARPEFALVLVNLTLLSDTGTAALARIRRERPDFPVISYVESLNDDLARRAEQAGVTRLISLAVARQLAAAVQAEWEHLRSARLNRCMNRLVEAVSELSLARSIGEISRVVREASREIAGAEGSTFVLREGNNCFYVDESAISPLWKGQRFPMDSCVSGWVMHHGEALVIEDIFSDQRVPIDVYEKTFVKSLAMVPIRTESPLGAIGSYWARRHRPSKEELDLLQKLANTTAVAIENVRVYEELDQRVKRRTRQLEAANRELETFTYTVAHDLGAPLRGIRGFSNLLLTETETSMTAQEKEWVKSINSASEHMGELMGALLRLSRLTSAPLRRQKVDLSGMAEAILRRLAESEPARKVETRVSPSMVAEGDAGLLEVVLENLLGNAWKYSSKNPAARIEFEYVANAEGGGVFQVKDNGIGFDMGLASKLFQPFQRLHTDKEFPGTGVGLATVQRIIRRHGGKIWVDSSPGQGSCFSFTLQPS